LVHYSGTVTAQVARHLLTSRAVDACSLPSSSNLVTLQVTASEVTIPTRYNTHSMFRAVAGIKASGVVHSGLTVRTSQTTGVVRLLMGARHESRGDSCHILMVNFKPKTNFNEAAKLSRTSQIRRDSSRSLIASQRLSPARGASVTHT
jgi:hypothetical protein